MPDDDAELEQQIDGGAPRSLWSGSITFGLLSLAVDLFPAVRTEALPLKMVDAEHRTLTRRYYCPEHDRMLTRDEIVRGYEIEDGEFVILTDEELDALAPEKSRAIDLRKFIDAGEIDPMYFKRSYFLTPAGEEANRAYRLLAETMERSDRVGIATFVMRGKEYLVALLAEDGILRAETLRFSDELRRPEDVDLRLDVAAPTESVTRFSRAIAALAAEDVDRAELRDGRIENLRALIEHKLDRGIDVESAPEPSEEAEAEAEIIDLMEVLKRRLRPEARETAPAPQERADRKAPEPRGRRARPASRRDGAEGDLAGQSKSELYERAKALGVPGRSRMDREALLRALREAGG